MYRLSFQKKLESIRPILDPSLRWDDRLNKRSIVLALSLVALGVAVRLLPHLWNATPLAAIAILSGRYLGKRWAVALPIVTLIIGDMFIGFYEWPLMLCVYSCLGLIGLMSGIKGIQKTFGGLAVLSISSSVIFFLVTNWAVWQFSPWYEKTMSGLFHCYLLGLPFFRNALIGDLFYTLTLFLLIELSLKHLTCRLKNKVSSQISVV